MSQYSKEIDQKEVPSFETSQNASTVKDPNWLMSIPKITKSSIEGFKNCCQIYTHEFAMNREIEKSVSKDIMKPNGGLIGYDLKVIVASSSINADAHLYFYQNVPLKTVILHRIGKINLETPQSLETYTFTLCYITSIVAKGDYLAITFRYSGVERKTPEIKKNGATSGMHAAHHDFIKVKSDAGTPAKKEPAAKKKKKKAKKSKKKSKK